MSSFGWIDWGIIAVYLIGTMAAGLAMRRYVGKVEHFIVAGREMDVYLGIASLAATEFGIITAMYTDRTGLQERLRRRHSWNSYGCRHGCSRLDGFRHQSVAGIGCSDDSRAAGPKVWKAGSLALRSGHRAGGPLKYGSVPEIGGEFLMIVSGIPLKYLEITMTVLLLVVLVYTTLGGMLSVLVTDYLQFIVMGIGLVVVSVLVATHISWTSLVDGVQRQLGTGAFNPLVSPEMGVTYVLWQALNQLAVVLTWQTVIAAGCWHPVMHAWPAKCISRRVSSLWADSSFQPLGNGGTHRLTRRECRQTRTHAMPSLSRYIATHGSHSDS